MRFFFGFVIVISGIVLGNTFSPVQAQATDAWDAARQVVVNSELTDMVVMVGTADGILFTESKGIGYPEFPSVAIFSSSKWWTAATILSLVEEGTLALDDHPQDYIDWWTDDPTDMRSQITLEQLISMTAGFRGEPLCLFARRVTLEDCALEIYHDHHFETPGSAFFYASTHMQIAGLMAVEATGESFHALFRRTIGDPLEMQTTTGFTLPTEANPWLAGGGLSSPVDFAKFMQAIMAGDLLPETRELMFTDHTQDPVVLLYTPVQTLIEWHYGLGVWKECIEPAWPTSCDEGQVFSSGGGQGWYPWIDWEHGYFGLIARQDDSGGALGPSFALSYELRPQIIAALEAIG